MAHYENEKEKTREVKQFFIYAMLAMCSLQQGRNNRFDVCTLSTMRAVSSDVFLKSLPLATQHSKRGMV